MKNLFQKYWRELVYEPGDKRRYAGKEIKIVAIGGGTGLSTLLRGIKQYSDNITAVVTMADSGGSTGKLREEFDIPAPGDIRKCIASLAYDENLISDILNFRFSKNSNSLSNHTLGNIWLTALVQKYGSFEKAVELTSQIFFTSGKILPATLDKVKLVAKYNDGTSIVGEENIPKTDKKIVKIKYDKRVKAYQKSVDSINKADLILIGPGSLYTSIIPNLIIDKITSAIISNRQAVKIYLSNVSTEKGETENFSIEDHIKTIEDHCGNKRLFSFCLANNRLLKTTGQPEKKGEINNITTTRRNYHQCQIFQRDIINRKNPLYHDPNKLAKEIIDIYIAHHK